MITFNGNKWPHKYVKEFGWVNQTPNLCQYVWQLIISALFFWTIAVLIGTTGGSWLIGTVIIILGFFPQFVAVTTFESEDFIGMAVLGSYMVWAFILFTALAGVSGSLMDKKRKRKNKSSGIKQDSVAVEWIKAKKRKICPLVRIES